LIVGLQNESELITRHTDAFAILHGCSLTHPLINVWQEDDGVVILEVTSIWHFRDDTVIKINACSIFTVADGKFVDQRIYVDNAPVDPFLG
jgi:hypothetical protein